MPPLFIPPDQHQTPARPEPRREVCFWRSPACPGVELRRASYRRQTFHRHTHPVYSLGLVLSGSTEFDYCGQHFCAQTGDLVLIAPGVVHDCNPQGDEPLGYWMFYLDAAVLGAPTADRATPPPVLADPGLWQHWQQLAQQLVHLCQLPPNWRRRLQRLGNLSCNTYGSRPGSAGRNRVCRLQPVRHCPGYSRCNPNWLPSWHIRWR